MRSVLAIARLTFWEGIRMRIVLVFLIVLVFVVLRFPFALRGDDTLSGGLRTFLDYSLGALSVLMSLTTVFFSCATLANKIKNNTIHLVVTKPVTRFQILVGKWLGVNLLNVLLVVLCGTTIYAFARYISHLPEQFARDRLMVRDVVWTARAAADPTKPDFKTPAREIVRQRVKEGALQGVTPEAIASDADFDKNAEALKALAERMRELEYDWLKVHPESGTLYRFNDLPAPRTADEVIQVRFKARGIPLPREETLRAGWIFVDPETEQRIMDFPLETAERSGDMHQFLVRARAIKNGQAALLVLNPPDPEQKVTINFDNASALQILYKVGSFEMNYLKALLMILFRLAFLSAVGLLFSVFVSFPIACLAALSTYIIGLGKPWWMDAIGANIEYWTPSIDPFGKWGPAIRFILLPILNVLFPDFVKLDGTARLVDGLYIPNELLAWSAAHTLLFGVVLLFGVGWLVFQRREIAEVVVT